MSDDMRTIDPESPVNYSRDGRYPLAGTKLGPAWRKAWRIMADGGWHSKADLVAAMMADDGIREVTASNMLRDARRAGVLTTRRRTRPDGGCAPSDYKIV